MSLKATVAMLFANEVWAVYGIGVPGGYACVGCQPAEMEEAIKREESPTSIESSRPKANTSTQINLTTSTAVPTTHVSTHIHQPDATNTVPFNTPSATISIPSQTFAPTTSTSPSSMPPPPSANGLETGVKIGIGVLGGILGLALLAFLVESCYLRRRRREKALQRAVEEVENGERALAEWKESREIVVLESRVSIVITDGSEDEDGEEVEVERGRTRNGMSLARRQY